MARRRGRGRKNESLVEVLLASPWQVSIGVGVAVFVGLKWVLPAMAGGNMFLKPISAAASSVAWLFAGAFFLIGFLQRFSEDNSLAPAVLAPNFNGRLCMPAD